MFVNRFVIFRFVRGSVGLRVQNKRICAQITNLFAFIYSRLSYLYLF